MRRLISGFALLMLVTGCNLKDTLLTPTQYATVRMVTVRQWKAGHLTTSDARERLADADECLRVYTADHYLSPSAKALIETANAQNSID